MPTSKRPVKGRPMLKICYMFRLVIRKIRPSALHLLYWRLMITRRECFTWVQLCSPSKCRSFSKRHPKGSRCYSLLKNGPWFVCCRVGACAWQERMQHKRAARRRSSLFEAETLPKGIEWVSVLFSPFRWPHMANMRSDFAGLYLLHSLFSVCLIFCIELSRGNFLTLHILGFVVQLFLYFVIITLFITLS